MYQNTIRAKQDLEDGELYVNLNDLKDTFKKDWMEVFKEDAEQSAGFSLLMLLELVGHWYQPYKSTSFVESLASEVLELDQEPNA